MCTWHCLLLNLQFQMLSQKLDGYRFPGCKLRCFRTFHGYIWVHALVLEDQPLCLKESALKINQSQRLYSWKIDKSILQQLVSTVTVPAWKFPRPWLLQKNSQAYPCKWANFINILKHAHIEIYRHFNLWTKLQRQLLGLARASLTHQDCCSRIWSCSDSVRWSQMLQ